MELELLSISGFWENLYRLANFARKNTEFDQNFHFKVGRLKRGENECFYPSTPKRIDFQYISL